MIPWILHEIGYTIWLLLPPYLANSSAVLLGGKYPIDFGRKFVDGRRIFGDGKTWSGFLGGSLVAALVALIEWGIGKLANLGPYLGIPFYYVIFMGFCFGAFALIGDLIESFFKRRANLPRGAPLPIADQLDFVLSFYLFSYLAFRGWFLQNLLLDRIVIGLVITPLLHYAFNYLGYLLGKKEVPWRMLARKLVELGAIKFGKFRLKSGRISDYYVDIKEASTRPEVFREICLEIAIRARDYDKMAGMELGAVPLLAGTSIILEKPYIIVRKEEKTHGIGRRIIGEVLPHEKVVIVEDVTTTGSSALEVAKILREMGAKVDKVISVVDREEGAEENLRKEGISLDPVLRISEVRKIWSSRKF